MPFDLNSDFSEFIGVVIGDGCLYGNFNKYVIMLTGNAISDVGYYIGLQEKLRDIGVKSVIKTHSNGLRLIINNKNLFKFLQDELGMKYKSKKTYEAKIPERVLESRENIKSCIRGLFNADGTVSTSDKPGSPDYPTIEIATVSGDLASQVERILTSEGFRVRTRRFHDKGGKADWTYRVALHGHAMIRKWYLYFGCTHQTKNYRFMRIMSGAGVI
jgi:hypothetical protein